MTDGENRVGFVKQDTADKYIEEYGGEKKDYKLLCPKEQKTASKLRHYLLKYRLFHNSTS